MALRNPSTTTDAAPANPRLLAHGSEWPTLDTEHDPTYLAENDPVETEPTTLADYGAIVPDDFERRQDPDDTRDRTHQTSVFQFPRKWWHDADRLETLFCDRDLSIAEISDLLGDDVGYEGIRSNLNQRGVRDPDANLSGAALLAATDPEDVGLSPLRSKPSDTKFSKRGRA